MMDVCGKRELPGDLDDLRRRAKSVALNRAVRDEPAIEILLAQGKYGPFRECIVASFSQSRRSKGKGSKVRGSKSGPKVKLSKVRSTVKTSQSKVARTSFIVALAADVSAMSWA